ncbi:mandelate racemase/muconate lactonizing enzyme family protein [Lacticaseibacillus daqingensis]|uniref:mandelate racemase/muconate lactonizing enzyme family protein n=1 Tax=Lacticaseibacillus daqingensis TaxID=2486014 RepID=UPI000F7792DC|nr:dipeptide epimerase [Lacticaseibacillus daqingensis]
MQIKTLTVHRMMLHLRQPATVTFATFDAVPSLLVRLETDTGLVGYGEANPVEQVTGETVASSIAALATLRPVLVGTDPLSIEAAHRRMDAALLGHTALKAGIDLALYDLLGKHTGLPLYQLLGGNANAVTTDITVMLNSASVMIAEAKARVAEGFTALKIKTGLDEAHDRTVIAGILAAVPPTVSLKLDANQGWTPKQTIRMMRQFDVPNLTIVEQPLPAWQTAGNPLVRAGITQDLMLDETVHDAHDAAAAVAAGACDAINIKLMKASGLWGAEAINRVAEAAGVYCMIGCMAESRLGIAAAAHFAAAHANVRDCDLDSVLLLEETPWLQGGFTQTGEQLVLSDAPGLGVTVDEEALNDRL